MPAMFEHLDRAHLATTPTPLEQGPIIGGGARLWVKRDDLTGLGGGGNKARKLEFLCGDAQRVGARALVTVGAGQSNHCRMTAAAGARLGMEVHLILSGDEPEVATGNQLLSALFGAQLHFTGAAESHWGELEIAREALTNQLADEGLAPYSIPIGGSTAIGALGYAAAFVELVDQCANQLLAPSTVVFTSSSGGTHAGLLAGRAALIAAGRSVPDVIAIGVAKGVNIGLPSVADLANETLDLMQLPDVRVDPADVEVDTRWIGDNYAVPTKAADEAIRWAATNGGWLLDRTYSGKGLSGALGLAAEGRFGDSDLVFIHTGGWPALFAPDGLPA
jgi:1-aminocyclopropane-1-carboxylate deaminase/D-cysteine desulfhydrase-like pyridoxal-dependent ACC family enzyme